MKALKLIRQNPEKSLSRGRYSLCVCECVRRRAECIDDMYAPLEHCPSYKSPWSLTAPVLQAVLLTHTHNNGQGSAGLFLASHE